MNWIREIIHMIINLFGMVIGALNELCDKIDAVEFANDTILIKAFGLIRYLFGEIPYTLFVSTIYIGAGYVLYLAIREIISLIFELVPTLKGKFIFR